MTDKEFDWRDKPITFEQLMEELEQFGRHVKAWQHGDKTISLDFSGIHIEVFPPEDPEDPEDPEAEAEAKEEGSKTKQAMSSTTDARFSTAELSHSYTAEYDHQTDELTLYASGARWDTTAETAQRLRKFLNCVLPPEPEHASQPEGETRP